MENKNNAPREKIMLLNSPPYYINVRWYVLQSLLRKDLNEIKIYEVLGRSTSFSDAEIKDADKILIRDTVLEQYCFPYLLENKELNLKNKYIAVIDTKFHVLDNIHHVSKNSKEHVLYDFMERFNQLKGGGKYAAGWVKSMEKALKYFPNIKVLTHENPSLIELLTDKSPIYIEKLISKKKRRGINFSDNLEKEYEDIIKKKNY